MLKIFLFYIFIHKICTKSWNRIFLRFFRFIDILDTNNMHDSQHNKTHEIF